MSSIYDNSPMLMRLNNCSGLTRLTPEQVSQVIAEADANDYFHRSPSDLMMANLRFLTQYSAPARAAFRDYDRDNLRIWRTTERMSAGLLLVNYIIIALDGDGGLTYVSYA